MKTLLSYRVQILAALCLIGTVCAAEEEAVISPAKRQQALDLAKSLLGSKTLVATSKDPFHVDGSTDVVPDKPVDKGHPTTEVRNPNGALSPLELLKAIANSPSLKPSGFFVLSGQPTLVFGQKRVKAGGFLTITFEGTEYALEIVSIDRPNFTLRLNREEYTRPIK